MDRNIAVVSTFLVPLVLTVNGCSASKNFSALAETRDSPALFKLYSEPKATPEHFCDQYLELQLGSTTAKLVNKLAAGSSCEVFVPPSPVTYNLASTRDSCGATVYEGLSTWEDGTKASVKIVDSRGWTCVSIPPARIVVTETTDLGSATRYSYDVETTNRPGVADAPQTEIIFGRDSRPVDGILNELKLKKSDDGTFVATLRQTGFRWNGQQEVGFDETKALGSRLECEFAFAVVSCRRDDRSVDGLLVELSILNGDETGWEAKLRKAGFRWNGTEEVAFDESHVLASGLKRQ